MRVWHPDRNDQLVSYHRLNNEGRNISGTLVMEKLRRQLEGLNCEYPIGRIDGG